MELGMISSTWLGTKIDRLEGIRKAKAIGFDTYDVFEDPLDLTDDERREIKETCEEVGLQIRSVVCVAFGHRLEHGIARRSAADRARSVNTLLLEVSHKAQTGNHRRHASEADTVRAQAGRR